MRGTEESGNYLENLKHVQLPDKEDMLCTPEMGRAMHQALLKAELGILPGIGHTLNLESIPDLAQLTDTFVTKVKQVV